MNKEKIGMSKDEIEISEISEKIFKFENVTNEEIEKWLCFYDENHSGLMVPFSGNEKKDSIVESYWYKFVSEAYFKRTGKIEFLKGEL